MTGIPDLGIRVDIMGRVLDPLLCVFLADIQSVGIGACMHVCIWYTELTCISNGVSKTDNVVGSHTKYRYKIGTYFCAYFVPIMCLLILGTK